MLDSPADIDVDLAVSALLPVNYIEDETQRMEMLRRLSTARGTRATSSIADEMQDRFGRLPGAARNLVAVFRARDPLPRARHQAAVLPG
ncbi:MAG: TRCF domain-containing protein [Planctomycetota bacterium]